MCNFRHENSKSLRNASGIGYKIFEIPDRTMVGGKEYHYDSDRWVSWRKDGVGDGFCVFTERLEAEDCCLQWASESYYRGKYVVEVVKYEKAVCSHIEKNIFILEGPGYNVLLVKRFKVEGWSPERFKREIAQAWEDV